MSFPDQPSPFAKKVIGMCFLAISLFVVAVVGLGSFYVCWLILKNMGVF